MDGVTFWRSLVVSGVYVVEETITDQQTTMKITITVEEWIPTLDRTVKATVSYDSPQVLAMGPETLYLDVLTLQKSCRESVEASLKMPREETNT